MALLATPATLTATEVTAVPVVVHMQAAGSTNAPVIVKRDRVIVSVVVGVARIERQAAALQNARAGQMLFVRTDDGEVMTVRAGKLP